MLAYILAIAVAIASFGFYIGAFFFPEIHRKEDFYWSGVGLFYALVLWVCAGRITGGVLLGQAASVALLGWFGWQTIRLRWELTPAAQRTEVPSQAEVTEKIGNLGMFGRITGFFSSITGFITKLTQRQSKPDTKLTQPTTTELKTSPTTEPSRPIVEVINSTTTDVAVVNTTTDVDEFEDTEDTEVEEPVRPHPPAPELVEAALEDAEAKHIPADPPATEPETVETEVVSPETQS